MKHVSLSSSILRRSTLKHLAAFVTVGMLLPGPVLASGDSGIPAVGEVTFVLGKAYVEKADGTRQIIKTGTSVNESDKIETGSNSHVHIRFIDKELVSVRPSSLLEIVRYDYDASAPENSAINLNIVEGVTRAISGKAAQAAPKNFRMDTPIAAIGVRGTDFVVSSSPDGVRAHVNEGAIIIAPYSNECLAAAFGPCSLNALELAGGSNQIVEISSTTNEALFLSLSAPAIPEVSEDPPEVAAVEATSEAKTKDDDLYKDSVTSKAVTQTLVARNTAPVPPSPPVAVPPPVMIPEFTPAVSATTEALTSNQLVWGRWYDSTSTELERITVAYGTAREGNRKITVGSDIYALFRAQTGSEVQRGLGALGFNLTQAQAILRADGQTDLMSVTGGMLNIDFDQSNYSTNIQMNNSATGNVEFRDTGRVFSSGIFHSNNRNGLESMAGAVSIDGTEAGYFFEKTLPSGVIEGLTLWGVKP